MLSRVKALQPHIPAPGLLMQRQGHRKPAAKVQRLSASGGFFGTVQRPSCKAMNSRMTCRGGCGRGFAQIFWASGRGGCRAPHPQSEQPLPQRC